MIGRLGASAAVVALNVLVCGAAFGQAPSGQVLPGAKSNEPINIDAGKLDYFDKEQKLVYAGNVVAVQGGSRLKASTLVIYLAPKGESDASGPPSGDAQVRRMEASGPVTMTSKDQVGTGDSGFYEKADNKVTLVGNVTLTQGPNVTKGDHLVYDLKTQQAVVQGHVRSMFIPKNGSASEASAGTETPAKPAKPPARSERGARPSAAGH